MALAFTWRIATIKWMRFHMLHERESNSTAQLQNERARVDHCIRWAAFLLLAGYLLFAHGCHAGDHDNELFAQLGAALFP